jgi:integrase
VTLATAEQRYREHLQAKNRKRSTIEAVESAMRVWWLPLYGDRALDRISAEAIEDAIAAMAAGRRPGRDKRSKACGPKTIVNYVGILAAVYHYAMHPRRRWVPEDPTDLVDLPEVEDNEDIRFFDLDEIDLLVANVTPGVYAQLDAAFYLLATRSGLRHRELVALRWLDVDWRAMRLRVRQNYVLGEYGTPKSRRSTRSVPLDLDAAGPLERLYKPRASPTTTRSSSLTRTPASRCPRPPTTAATARPSRRRAWTSRTASTTCATPSARRWRLWARRCARCRCGWATATSRRRSAMPTTRRTPARPTSSPRRLPVAPFVAPFRANPTAPKRSYAALESQI